MCNAFAPTPHTMNHNWCTHGGGASKGHTRRWRSLTRVFRKKQIFAGAKDFCPNLPKKLCNFCRPFSWCDLQINGLHLFFCKTGAPFLPRFSGILPRYLGILFGFSGILTKFSRILPGFSTNQNFWGCACTPSTTAHKVRKMTVNFFYRSSANF